MARPSGQMRNVSGTVRRWTALLLALSWFVAAASAAPGAAEQRAFDAAARAFNDGFHERAEKEFGEFVMLYPQSSLLPRATLLQAQSKFQQKQYKPAIALLNAALDTAGALADQYVFWIAEAEFELGNFSAAADGFSRVVAKFPESPRRLEAAYREALARFKLTDVKRAIDLLRDGQGAFQQAASSQVNEEYAVRGELLLAEALLQQKDYRAAENVLTALGQRKLNAELAWQRQYWATRGQFESGDAELALAGSTALAALASASGSRDFQAETMALQGTILQRLNQFEAAIQSYERNLDAALPAERRRQAMLRIIELSIAKNEPTKTVGWLERFLKEFPQDSSADFVRLTLGEMQLKDYFALADAKLPATEKLAARSNLLSLARAQLDKVVTDFPQSAFVGKAQFDRGLTFWEEDKFVESQEAFQKAVEQLPVSEDQAMARFKLADSLFQQRSLAAAVSNYQAVIERYETLPRVKAALMDQALYQIVRASTELGDLATASAAIAKIIVMYPDSFFSDRSLLLFGQSLSRIGKPAEARVVFVDFLKRFPESLLAPEVHLAIARTYVQDQNWTAGMGKYDDWLRKYPSHGSRPQAEFDLAWINYQAGRQTNALQLFSRFLETFPTNQLAPIAQDWVANHYWTAGDFPNAEKNYQLLYQNTNWPPSELTYHARLMAGRAAVARQVYKDAQDYFAGVFNDEKAPPDIVAKALLFWGDTKTEERSTDPAKALDKFAEAINAYSRIVQRYPTNSLVPRALGNIGKCHFQLAVQDPKRYDLALESFRKVLEHPAADVETRSQAEVGIGLVFEKQAALKIGPEQVPVIKQALTHYLNVFYGKNLKDSETADPFWRKEAGLYAAALAEGQLQWSQAVKLYRDLIKEFPPLQTSLEKKLKAAADHLSNGGN